LVKGVNVIDIYSCYLLGS